MESTPTEGEEPCHDGRFAYPQGILTPQRVIIVLVVAALSLAAACGGGLDSSLVDLEVGDCVKAPGLSPQIESLDRVDCSESNALRVNRVFDIIEYDDYPGDATIQSIPSERCPSATVTALFPTRDSWNQDDDREVICFEWMGTRDVGPWPLSDEKVAQISSGAGGQM